MLAAHMMKHIFIPNDIPKRDEPAMAREAMHQIAISSYVNLVERQRLPRLSGFSDKTKLLMAKNLSEENEFIPYIDDRNLRHYAYTICGNVVTVWVTTLQK